jgi:hypothetical protein
MRLAMVWVSWVSSSLVQAYLKASNTDAADEFGTSVALSGNTLSVAAFREGSNATGVNGDESNNSQAGAGAVYVFHDVNGDIGFAINAGLNDAWYNPATPGQGFFVTVYPDIGQVFLAWFTYDVERPPSDVEAILGDPGARWLTAFGPYVDNTAMLDIEITSGGVFDSAEPIPAQNSDGTIFLEFVGCNEGTVVYDIPSINRQSIVPIERIALDNVLLSESL